MRGTVSVLFIFGLAACVGCAGNSNTVSKSDKSNAKNEPIRTPAVPGVNTPANGQNNGGQNNGGQNGGQNNANNNNTNNNNGGGIQQPSVGGTNQPNNNGGQNNAGQTTDGAGAALGGDFPEPNNAGNKGFQPGKRKSEPTLRQPQAGGTGGATNPPPQNKGGGDGPGASVGGDFPEPNNTGKGKQPGKRKNQPTLRQPQAGGAGGGVGTTNQPPQNKGGGDGPGASVGGDFPDPSSGNGTGQGNGGRNQPNNNQVSFVNTIAPLLNTKCGKCHVQQAKEDVSFATYQAIMNSGHVKAGDTNSEILKVTASGGSMPPKKGGGTPLNQTEYQNLKLWIEQGAKFDGTNQTQSIAQLGNNRGGGFTPPPRRGGTVPPARGGNNAGGGNGGGPVGNGGTLRQPTAGNGGGGTLQPPTAGNGGGGGTRGGRGGGQGAGGTLQPPTAGNGSGGGGGQGTGNPNNNNQTDNDNEQFDPNSWLGYAAAAFNDGDEIAAFQYIYGHMLTQPGGMDQFPMKWVSGLGEKGEPRVALRFGYGIVYETTPKSFDQQPPVIGDPPSRASNRRRPSSGRDRNRNNGPENDMSKYKGVDKSSPAGTMYYYLGDLGDRLQKELNKRRTAKEGNYGVSLQNMPSQDVASVLPATGTARRGAPQQLEDDLVIDQNSQNNTNSDKDEPEVIGTIQPGLMLIGKGTEKELIARAKKADLDALIVFKVTIRATRTGVVKNTTKFRVITPKNGKLQYSSRGLDHSSVFKSRENLKDSSKDPVQLLVSGMFNKIGDEKFSMTKLPEMKPEEVKTRVETITSNYENALPVAIEILNYHRMGLLTDDETKTALAKMFGEEGAASLMNGSAQQKQAAIAKWLPDQYKPDLGL